MSLITNLRGIFTDRTANIEIEDHDKELLAAIVKEKIDNFFICENPCDQCYQR